MSKFVRSRSIDTVFVLIVFSIFAVSVLMVLMLGASIYQNINDISREDELEQTALSYIWTKTKNFDKAGSISIGDFNGKPALFFNESLGGTDFRTAVYHYDGWLYELFSDAALEFSPADGERVVMVDDLSFESAENGLFRVSSGDIILLLYPRSGLDLKKGVDLS